MKNNSVIIIIVIIIISNYYDSPTICYKVKIAVGNNSNLRNSQI